MCHWQLTLCHLSTLLICAALTAYLTAALRTYAMHAPTLYMCSTLFIHAWQNDLFYSIIAIRKKRKKKQIKINTEEVHDTRDKIGKPGLHMQTQSTRLACQSQALLGYIQIIRLLMRVNLGDYDVRGVVDKDNRAQVILAI